LHQSEQSDIRYGNQKFKGLSQRGRAVVKKKIVFQFAWGLLFFALCPMTVIADDLKPIRLMQLQFDTGRPLMHVLKARKSSRAFSAKKLPTRVTSNLLWSAYGINRMETGGRTAPSAMNQQEMDIYVAMAEGLYLFDAKAHLLKPILKEDIRAMTGLQLYVKDAPVSLIYVADYARMTRTKAEDRDIISAADAGFIGQNVYLYCASEGLATVVRATIDRVALASVMKLRPEQKIVLAQSVGYPKK
jgi:nitroreductase